MNDVFICIDNCWRSEHVRASSFIQKAKDPQDVIMRLLEMSGNGVHDILTLPVSVASNERSFSKLKLLKTYSRASCLTIDCLT